MYHIFKNQNLDPDPMALQIKINAPDQDPQHLKIIQYCIIFDYTALDKFETRGFLFLSRALMSKDTQSATQPLTLLLSIGAKSSPVSLSEESENPKKVTSFGATGCGAR
mgnify:FL=1